MAFALLLLGNLQPLATPDPFDPVLAQQPARMLQQCRDPAIAVAAILAGQHNDGLGERIFVVPLRRPVTLRAAWLFHHSARPPFTHALFLSMIHPTAPSIRA